MVYKQILSFCLLTCFVLFPCVARGAPSPNRGRHLVVIDPGHGGVAFGTQVGSVKESVLTLKTAKKLAYQLKKRGYLVVMTRTKDTFVSLEKRVKIANTTKCHLFVSIHYNAHHNVNVHGMEVFYYKNSRSKWRVGKSKKAATSVLNFLIKETQAHSRGVKHGNFHVIRNTSAPGILVEGGFVTHAKERKKLLEEAYLDQIVKGIVLGIDHYFS